MPRPPNPQLKNEILRVTMELVELRGPEGLTMQEVASRIGYSPTTIYLYFEDKGDLLDHAITRGAEWLADVLEKAARHATSPEECLRRIIRAYVEWGQENTGVYRLVLETPPPSIPSDEVSRTRMRGFMTIRDIIREALDTAPDSDATDAKDRSTGATNGGLTPLDADALTRLLWACAHGLTSLLVTRRLLGAAIDPEEALPTALGLADALVEQFVRAWLPPSASGVRA